jgi:hypothetical protein
MESHRRWRRPGFARRPLPAAATGQGLFSLTLESIFFLLICSRSFLLTTFCIRSGIKSTNVFPSFSSLRPPKPWTQLPAMILLRTSSVYTNIRYFSFLLIYLIWYISSLLLVCRFIYYRVYLVYFKMFKTFYIHRWREYTVHLIQFLMQSNMYDKHVRSRKSTRKPTRHTR